MVCLVISSEPPSIVGTVGDIVMRGGGTVKSIRPVAAATGPVHSSAGFGDKLGLELVVDIGEHWPDDEEDDDEAEDIDAEDREDGGGWCKEDCDEGEDVWREGGGHQVPLLEIRGS